MRKFFRELISDDNHINEQAFVGVISFFAMVFVLLVDVITGILSKELVIQEFIFDDANVVEGRYSIIRSIDIIYGGELDVVHMGGYRQSTIIPLTFTETETLEASTKLIQKSRIKFSRKNSPVYLIYYALTLWMESM